MLPGDSRTSVQHDTFAGLTAGFGMGPGVSRQLWPLSPRVLLVIVEESQAILLLVKVQVNLSESQGPDLNRS